MPLRESDLLHQKRINKYRAKKVKTEEGTFDSQREYAIWCELKIRQKVGEIYGLARQCPFILKVNTEMVGVYVADFDWFEKSDRRYVVADCKSKPTMTPVYRLKRKLMKAIHGIDILEMS